MTRTAHAAKTSSPSNGSGSAAGGRRLRDRRAQEGRDADSRKHHLHSWPRENWEPVERGEEGSVEGYQASRASFISRGASCFGPELIYLLHHSFLCSQFSAILPLEPDNHRPCQKSSIPSPTSHNGSGTACSVSENHFMLAIVFGISTLTDLHIAQSPSGLHCP